MPRSPEISKQLRDFCWTEYVVMSKSQAAIVRTINEDPELVNKFGKVSPESIWYHCNEIEHEMENLVGIDAIDKFTAEYVRARQTIEREIDDVEECIKLIDKEKNTDTWIRLKRMKKELIETKLKMMINAELPLAVKKLKKERELNNKKILKVEEPKEIGDRISKRQG